MPILEREIDLFPNHLFSDAAVQLAGPTGQSGCPAENVGLGPAYSFESSQWWVLYSLSRQEKLLTRRLRAQEIAFYCPTVQKRNRSPAGRVRVSYLPLFSNYVFMLGGEDQRRAALATRCVSRALPAPDQEQLARDLRQIHRLIATGAPITAEQLLQPGSLVRVKTGAFRGFEGVIQRRQGRTHLLVAVNFLQQGASVLIDDCQVERLD